jgi:glycosyltransferase involved in cell wall biosynthesis
MHKSIKTDPGATLGRVVMLVENLSFPWDRRMRHLARTLQRAGYEVRVICPKGETVDRQSFEVVDGVHVYRYPSLVQASRPLAYLIEYSWAFLCTAILSLYIWMRYGFDIIHSANPPDIFFLLAWPFKLIGKKFVFDEHDVCPELYESKFNRRDLTYRVLLAMERFSYRTANLIISTNQSYRDIARQRGGVSEKRLAIVRNGVDLEYFHLTQPRPELKGSFRYMALYLGVMGKQDGVDRVIHAAHHVIHTRKRDDLRFVLVGKGECWNDLKRLAKELDIDHAIQFVGRISDALLLDYLSTADLCLAPDPPDQMNQLSTMTKILEYMACQRPIVSFDLVETRRSAGDAAVYVQEDDARQFGDAINQLLEDAPRRNQMGRVGLDRTLNLIGWDRSREALLEAYSGLFTGDARSKNQRPSSASISQPGIFLSPPLTRTDDPEC